MYPVGSKSVVRLHNVSPHLRCVTHACIGPYWNKSGKAKPIRTKFGIPGHSGVARGGVWGVQTPPPIRIEAVFFTAVKLLLLNIITSL